MPIRQTNDYQTDKQNQPLVFSLYIVKARKVSRYKMTQGRAGEGLIRKVVGFGDAQLFHFGVQSIAGDLQ